jgi:O-antigen ligase
MSEVSNKPLRFSQVFSWGGVVVAILGTLALISGDSRSGLLLIVAGVVAWFFAKRRSRQATAAEVEA